MAKYENMVMTNQKKSKKMEDKAVHEIRRLLKADEEVTVAGLVKATGFSRGFFYNNERVNDELRQAREKQKGEAFATPKKDVIDRAMSKKIERLERELNKKDRIIADLQERLKKAEKDRSTMEVKQLKDIL